MSMSSVINRAVESAGGSSRKSLAIILVGIAVLIAGVVWAVHVYASSGPRSTAFPSNSAMEAQLGIRFSRVSVVGDGGLITVTYVVLDSEKAARFQADVTHPPVLLSESRNGATKRVALMKQGHALRAGQTYYLVYQNTRGALQHGERTTIVDGGLRLEHAPVL
ncbi:MAG: hypothetical protein M3Y44_07985 [Actinomycetota bacterium]|nr:hypothetical protein [Actinomycetota bacterium]